MLPYNPDEAKNERKTIKPGVYPFFVEKAVESKTLDDKEYTALTLKVSIDDRDVTCFDNMYYTPKALFRIAQFSEACGIDKPTEHDHYVGAQGKANFDLNERGFLNVKWYITDGPVQSVPTAPMENSSAEIDEIPF